MKPRSAKVDKVDKVDVVIVGAGVAAAVAALALTEAGFDVTCFEQGGWPERATFRGDTPAGELTAMKLWSSSPQRRQGEADYGIDTTASDMAALNYNGVGGGSVLYNAQWPRLTPRDFRVRTEDGVGADWPLDYAELQPFYEETDRQFGVSGLGGNPVYPEGEEPPLPALPIGSAGLAVARVHARRGWHWWPDSNAILSAPRDGRNPCAQRGTCGHGCDEGAKASTDLTHWPAYLAAGGSLITGAVVHRIVVDKADRAIGVEWVDAAGAGHFQGADVVLCAANGIGTPRLLLASSDSRHPDGLANDGGLVGRGLMLHPMALVEGIFPGGDPWHGHNGGLINSMQFYRSDAARGFVRGARWVLTAGGLPLATALGPRSVWGSGHHQRMRELVGRRVTWVLLGEDLSDDSNRVTLATGPVEAALPDVAITYRVGENTERLLQWHAAKAAESLAEAGLEEINVIRAPANGHFMGTARMGDDPATSVCDRWGFTHRIPNLGVLDGSVFPTSSGMNPTSTISALALRTARRLIEHSTDYGTRLRPPQVQKRVRSPSPAITLPPTALTLALAPAGLLTPAEREALAQAADELLPAGDGMPSAREVGIADQLVDEVLSIRPDLIPALRLALTTNGPAAFRTLATVIAGGYYLSPLVRDRLNWHNERGRVLGPAGFPRYVEEGLLDHLLTG